MTAPRVGVRWASEHPSWSLFLGFALIFLMLIPPGVIVIDGISTFSTADAIAKGHLYVPCAVSGYDALPGIAANKAAVIGRGGHCYSIWFPLISFLGAPLAGIGELLGKLAGVRGENVAELFALIVPALATAGAATLTAMLATKLGASRRGAVAAAVAFAFGTEALTYSRSFFAEPLAALLVAGAVWGLTERGARRRWAYIAIGVMVFAKPQLALVGPVLGGVLALQQRRLRAAAPTLIATGAGVVGYLFYNWLRFADAFKFGGDSQSLRFHNLVDPAALVKAVGLFFVSPGKGLLWYSPVIAIAAVLLWQKRRIPTAALSIGAAIAVCIVYLVHYYPAAGDSWGERYFLPALPLLCAALPAASARVAKVAAVLVVIALVSQIPTTLSFYDRTYGEHRDRGVDLVARRWSVPQSPLVTAWPAMVHQLRDAAHTNVRTLAKSANLGTPRSSVRDTQLAHVVALWWWLLPAIGIPWWVGAAFAAVVMGLGARLIARAAGLSRRAGPARRLAAAFPHEATQ